MAHLSNGRGTAVVKVKFRGVPLIRRALGTNDPNTIGAVETMYRALYQTGRTDVLAAIARKRLHPLAVLPQWRQGREIELPPADVLPRLADAWEEWAAKAAVSEVYRRDLRWTGRALHIPADATLAELPALLADLRKRYALKPPSFNHARAHVQAFLRDMVGGAHRLYAAVKDIRPIPRRARERGRPLAVAAVRELCTKLGAVAGPVAWTLAATGMGPKEFWIDGWEVLEDRVLIHGEKRKGRERTVPRWTPLVHPNGFSLRAFRELLRVTSGGAVTVYDFRRTFARWCEEAGVIETNRAAYLGHGPKSMSQLYSWGELPGQLHADAARLAQYAGEELPTMAVSA